MERTSFFSAVYKWVASTEMFARPSKQLPGKWLLFEYYTEQNTQLINYKEDQLKSMKRFWELVFETDGKLVQDSNIPIEFLKEAGPVKWQTSRNFLILKGLNDPESSVEFQFAISNGVLKLLRKHVDGKIEFFGFFRKSS